MKSKYRIDFFIPIDLDKLVPNGKVSVSSKELDALQPYINYYEGILLAAQKLAKDSIQLEIQIHEERNGTFDLNYLKSAKNLNESDLFIGFVQSRDIPNIAAYAKDLHINFISTFSPSDAGVTENPYFHILQPTFNTNFEVLINFVKKHYPKHKKFIFYQDDTRGNEMNLFIRQAFSKDKQLQSQVINPEILKKEQLMRFLDSNSVNVIFMPVLPPAEVDKILAAFEALPENYRLEIFGSPTWKYLKSIKQLKEKDNIVMYYTTAFHYDTATAIGKEISQSYTTSYKGKPGEMVYRGYENTIWFGHLLHKYGTIFNNSISDLLYSQFTDYDFQQVEVNGKVQYFENKFLYINKAHNGVLQFVK